MINTNYDSISKFLNGYNFKTFSVASKVREYFEFFNLDQISPEFSLEEIYDSNGLNETLLDEGEAFPANYNDLARLHYLVLSRKVVCGLELGSGYSTLILAHAMSILAQHFGDFVNSVTRTSKPFHIYSVEESEDFKNIAYSRLPDELKPFSTIVQSDVEIGLHDGRISTVFSQIPNVLPDFVYIDGPSQYANTKSINGFSIAPLDRMPMSSDILKMEFFFEPGAMILLDGRTSNARFLKAYLKRDWKYHHDIENDISIFELQETPLGNLNKQKMEFCLNGRWELI